MTLDALIAELNQRSVDFNTVMETIDNHYNFTPTRFQNGEQINEADTNNGSCKIFAFAKLNGLNEQAALNAFGTFYTQDVLQNPDGQDHGNIRNFIKTGWKRVQFDTMPLTEK